MTIVDEALGVTVEYLRPGPARAWNVRRGLVQVDESA